MHKKLIAIAMLIVMTLAVCWTASTPPAVFAAAPIGGAFSATAGSGGVTVKTFVKLSAARTVVAATAVTDSVIGVAETTAAAGAITSYAPVGTTTTVTSGELIAVGDKLTAGTGGKAFVLDADDASTQHVAGVALTAASGAEEDVTILLAPSVVEQRLAVAGALKTQTTLIVPGYKTGATTTAGGVLAIPVTHGVVAKTTGGVEALTLANGTAGQLLIIALATDGGDGTLTPTTKTGWATIVFADAGDSATLLYVDDTVGWVIIGLSGIAAPPVFTL